MTRNIIGDIGNIRENGFVVFLSNYFHSIPPLKSLYRCARKKASSQQYKSPYFADTNTALKKTQGDF
jgi:hypothetical protein